MHNKYYVYEWFFTDTDEVFYVGKGCGDRYRAISGRNKFFLDMYRTHPCDVRIIEKDLYEEDAYALEHATVLWYREHTNFRLTNQTDGGDGIRGFKPSPEHIAKIAKASKERWQDSEYKERVIAARHLPDSTYQSKEFKDKISSLVTGSKNPNYGHHWTNEMKDKARKRVTESGRYIGDKNPKARAIMCVETGEVFSCIKYAQEKYHVKCITSFAPALRIPTRTAADLHWRYISKESISDEQSPHAETHVE